MAAETEGIDRALNEMNGRGLTNRRARRLVDLGCEVNGVTRQRDLQRGKEFVKVELLIRRDLVQEMR